MGKKSISNIKNYLPVFSEDKIHVYSTKYIELIQRFIIFAQKQIEIGDEEYYKYIIQKGVNSIKHIFDMLFLYTKNIDLTTFHCRDVFSSFCVFPTYCETGERQIKFHSKGAILCLYQKTIFKINQEYRENFSLNMKDLEIINTIRLIQTTFDELLRIIIYREGHYLKDKNDYFFNTLITLIVKIMNNILKFKGEKKPNYKNIRSVLKNLLFLIRNLSNEKMDSCQFLNIIMYVSKKIYMKKFSIDGIKIKINNREELGKMLKKSPLKFSNWIYLDKNKTIRELHPKTGGKPKKTLTVEYNTKEKTA